MRKPVTAQIYNLTTELVELESRPQRSTVQDFWIQSIRLVSDNLSTKLSEIESQKASLTKEKTSKPEEASKAASKESAKPQESISAGLIRSIIRQSKNKG